MQTQRALVIGGSKEIPGTRAPPGGPNSFFFMQFSAKKLRNIRCWKLALPPKENLGSATGGEKWAAFRYYSLFAVSWENVHGIGGGGVVGEGAVGDMTLGSPY